MDLMRLILVEKKDRVCTIRLNRPERRNALSPELLAQFYQTMNSLKDDETIRTVVITGAGEKAFSAGFDIGTIPAMTRSESGDPPGDPLQEDALGAVFESISEYPYPVIAMLNGYTFGAGCELAITCDIRIATDTAKMGMPPVRLGILYAPTAILKFINTVGIVNTKEIFLTGRNYDTHRAKEMGLVNYVVPKDELKEFTYDMAREISENAPLSLRGFKKIIQTVQKYPGVSEEDWKMMNEMATDAFNSEDAGEGVMAFLGKRKAIFKGK